MRLRQLIAEKLPSYELYGEIEADESYFGGVRKGLSGLLGDICRKNIELIGEK